MIGEVKNDIKNHLTNPILFFEVFTNDIKIHSSNLNLFKYADDMALVGLIHHNVYDSDYAGHVAKWEQWCSTSSLVINDGQTKEFILNQTTLFS